jgi:threonine dehydrogenase-like Zn-dependent dehydrogenase
VQGTMKAARLRRVGEPVRLEEVPIPDITRGELLLRIRRTGLNRGDLHMREGDYSLGFGDTSNPLPDLPMTIGHDACGEIVEVGDGVHGLAVGDRVIVKARLTCGACKYCLSGREYLCVHHRLMGSFTLSTVWWGTDRPNIFQRYKDGFWAEYARVPATNVVRLEPDDDFDVFSRITEVANGYRTLKRGRLAVGETVIINGATGVTGTGAVLAALAMGAAQIIAIAQDPGRLGHIRDINPRRVSTISTKTQSIREEVARLTKGNGANVLMDLTPAGVETTVECLRSLEPGGRAVLFGGNTETLQVSYRFLMIWSIELISSLGRYHADIPELVDLVRRGMIDVSHMRPQFYRLEEINEAVDSFATRAGGDVPVWPMMRAD